MTPTVRIRAALVAIALTLTGVASGSIGATDGEAAVDYDAYIVKAAEAAKASKKLYGVPRAVTIAQSILESGWGRSGLATKYKNYFGIKCSSLISPYQKGCVALASYEYVKGKRKKYVSRFRLYSSMEKSFLDHGRFLDRADRYNAAFRYGSNPDRFIREVHRAGYATDPNYSNLVISLMKRWNLYRFDSGSITNAAAKSTLLISTTLTHGTRSAKVTALQNLLTNKGHQVRRTGYFGTITLAAVKAYQRGIGLKVTGRADPRTLTRLTPDLRRDASGTTVAALHALLRSRGYTVTARSSFGAKTLKSVRALQRKTRLPQTGIVSVRTWGVLFG